MLWILGTFPAIVVNCLPIRKVFLALGPSTKLGSDRLTGLVSRDGRTLHQSKSLPRRSSSTQHGVGHCTPVPSSYICLGIANEQYQQTRIKRCVLCWDFVSTLDVL